MPSRIGTNTLRSTFTDGIVARLCQRVDDGTEVDQVLGWISSTRHPLPQGLVLRLRLHWCPPSCNSASARSTYLRLVHADDRKRIVAHDGIIKPVDDLARKLDRG